MVISANQDTLSEADILSDVRILRGYFNKLYITIKT